LFSHYELHSLPPCQLFRFYIHYTIDFVDQPEFDALATIHELNLFRECGPTRLFFLFSEKRS
jgi:hypothetical protein